MSDPDPLLAWSQARERVVGLVRRADPEALQRHVPACPDWTVLDLLRHVVGLAADVLDGDEPDDHDPGWTQAQVDARAGHDVARLLAEWDHTAPELLRWMADHGSRPLNDVIVHEQDLRGALDVAGARDTEGFQVVRDRMATRFGGSVDGLPPVALVAPDWRWCSAGDPAAADTVLEASGFDLGRALTTRRTAEQLRSYLVRGDLEPYLGAFAALGDLPDRPLPE